MRRIAYLFLLFFISFSLLIWSSCGSSRQTTAKSGSSKQESGEDFDEIEKLLGISRDDSKKSNQPEKKQVEKKSSTQEKKQVQPAVTETKKQDDLITLLEVDEGKKTAPTTTATAPVEDQRLVRLQSQVEELQKEIRKKDMEIADLKMQIAMKDEALQKKSSTPTTDYSYATASSKPKSTPSFSGDDYVQNYQSALDLFHQRRYQEAITEFEQLLAVDSNHPYADNAQYWIGECYYAMGKYNEAIMAFEKVQSFPKSNKNDYALFKLGQCYMKLGNTESARREFQQLIDTYPESELAPRARKYLSQS